MANESEKVEQDLYSSKFNSFFNNNIIAAFKNFEKRRIIYLIICSIFALIAIIYDATIFYLNYMDHIKVIESPALLASVIFVPSILVIAISIFVKTYKEFIKKEIFNQLLTFIGDLKVDYNKDDREYIEQLKLFDKFNIFTCNNRIKGNYNSLDLDIQEIILYDTTKETVFFSSTIVFKGVLTKIPYDKAGVGRIIIKRKKNNKDRNYNEIFFEDYEFSKYYNVYADNESAAKSLITDSFINQMVKFAQYDKNRKISISFEKNNINIAISSQKDWFDVAFLKPATDISTYRDVISKNITLLKIIDFLKFELNINL